MKITPLWHGLSRKKTHRKLTLTMRVIVALLFGVVLQASANKLNQSIIVQQNNMKYSAIFKEVENQTGLITLYENSQINMQEKVELNVGKISIDKLYKQILNNKNLTYEIVKDFIVIKKSLKKTNNTNPNQQDQKKTITGKVTDQQGVSLPGVTVAIKGLTRGTTTNTNGEFTISKVRANNVLEFSFIGMKTIEIQVGNKTTINVTLEDETFNVNEVVVTALGIEKDSKALGYSVTQVGGEKFQENKTVNLAESLAGKVAGVNITTPSNGVASSSSIIIRGSSSISGNNQPLFVVDGIPIDNTQQGSPGAYGGADWGNGLSSLNPDEIETMSILKGNTAAALYGSRAQNGVVIIKTKTGRNRKGIGIEINSNTTILEIIDTYDLQKEYGHGAFGAAPTNVASALGENKWSFGGKLDGSMVTYFDGVERPYINRRDNLLKDFYRTGASFTNNIAILGGNEKHNIRFSFNQNKTTPTTPNSDYQRIISGINYNGQITSKLTVTTNAKYSWEKAHNRPNVGDFNNNIGFMLGTMPTTMDASMAIGNPNKPGTGNDGNEYQLSTDAWRQNPYFSAYQFDRGDSRDRFIGSAKINYNLTDWLYLRGTYGLDFWNARRYNIVPNGIAHNNGIGMSERNITSREINRELMVGIDHTFNNFSFNGFFGGSQMRYKYESYTGSGREFSIPFLYTINNTKRISFGKGFSQKGINSLYGSAEIGYKSYLFLTFTGRKDWFSTLDGSGIFYPAIGVSAVVSDMANDFGIELNKEIFSYAKIRASWAQVGGGADSPYQTRLTYSLISNIHNGASLGRITQSQIPSSNLKPLTNTEFEIGCDIRLLKNRIGIDFAYYNRKTTDDILSVNISNTSGYPSALMNIGEIENKGIELLLNLRPIDRTLKWNMSFTYAHNKNKVLVLDGTTQEVSAGLSRTHMAGINHIVGKPYSQIVGRVHKTINGQKVYTAQGYPVFTDDYRVLGNGIADKRYGLTNSFKYKNWHCSFLLDAQTGGNVYSASSSFLMEAGLSKQTLPGRDKGIQIKGVDQSGAPLERLVPYNEMAYYYNYKTAIATNHFYSTDFIKLREVSVGYDFSKLLKWKNIRELKLSFVGRNLAVLYSDIPNIDPESALNSGNAQGLEMFGLPPTRNYGFNLSIKL